MAIKCTYDYISMNNLPFLFPSVMLHKNSNPTIVTAHVAKRAMVMFSQVCVTRSVHRGEV